MSGMKPRPVDTAWSARRVSVDSRRENREKELTEKHAIDDAVGKVAPFRGLDDEKVSQGCVPTPSILQLLRRA